MCLHESVQVGQKIYQTSIAMKNIDKVRQLGQLFACSSQENRYRPQKSSAHQLGACHKTMDGDEKKQLQTTRCCCLACISREKIVAS